MKYSIITILCFFTSIVCHSQRTWMAASPDKSLEIVLTEKGGRLSYQVFSDKKAVIKTSGLGIQSSTTDFSRNLSFVNAVSKKIDEHYTLKIGKQKVNHAQANETTISFKSKDDMPVQIQLRAYNDGVAFRYRFSRVKSSMEITGEETEFAVPTEGKVWVQNYDLPTKYTPGYEGVYQNGIPIGTNAKDAGGWAFPALFQTGQHWLLLTESNLSKDFYGSRLDSNCANGVYKITKPLAGEGNGTGTLTAVAIKPFSTPWRVIMVGKKLATIIESNLVYHLAAPNTLGDVSWVKPGRSSWSWWGDHDSSKDFMKLKKFVDLAKEMGWEYSLVDANWDIMEGGTIEQLVAYAKTKNIRLILWYNSGGPHNTVSERPRDIMNDAAKRKEELKKLKKWGIAGIKVDFFQSDKQNIIQLYHDIITDAAKEKIMVNFHGCTLPRGWSRTYPNLVSTEAVRGAENYGWGKEFAIKAPELNVIYSFTRNVVGPMDYTPVTFSDYECCKHTTTNAHELALSVVFESGILHFADRAEPYQSLDARIKNFMRIVPTTWDETKFIQGEPGKEMVLARRNGSSWYVAGINGEDLQKNISLQLRFPKGSSYKASLFTDGRHSREIKINEMAWKKGNPVDITLLPNGGFVLVLQPVNNTK
ncbi:MAG: glycoside hydrolase family 97 catalytic domain-containing protein [Bacteroidota bacterium]